MVLGLSLLRVGQWPALQKGSFLVALEHVPRDDQPLDLTGAFVNLGDAGITVVPLSRHLCHIAHATQDLNSLRWKAEAQEGERWGRSSYTKGPAWGGAAGTHPALPPRGSTQVSCSQNTHLVADGSCGF